MHPATPPPHYLTSYGRRAAAADLINAHSGGYIADGLFLADALDAASAALMLAAHIPDEQARQILSTLWGRPPAPGMLASV